MELAGLEPATPGCDDTAPRRRFLRKDGYYQAFPGSLENRRRAFLHDRARGWRRCAGGAPRVKQRPHLGEVVVDDRLAAIEAELCDQLADALAGELGVGRKQPVDLLFEAIELRAPAGAAIAERVL
jgi:hypothetical protein